MAKSYCRFCGQRDSIINLVAVCRCHKKSDNALCHRACLEEYISKGTQSEDDQISSAAKVCPTCKQPFQVTLRHRWSSDRICSGVSIGQCFNLAMIILASLGFFVSVANVLASEDRRSKRIRPLTWAMAAVVAIMTVFVFRVIYNRWKRQQIEVELVDIV